MELRGSRQASTHRTTNLLDCKVESYEHMNDGSLAEDHVFVVRVWCERTYTWTMRRSAADVFLLNAALRKRFPKAGLAEAPLCASIRARRPLVLGGGVGRAIQKAPFEAAAVHTVSKLEQTATTTLTPPTTVAVVSSSNAAASSKRAPMLYVKDEEDARSMAPYRSEIERWLRDLLGVPEVVSSEAMIAWFGDDVDDDEDDDGSCVTEVDFALEDAPVEKITVRHGAAHAVTLNVPKRHFVVWSFASRPKDVAFALEKDGLPAREYERVPSHERLFQGVWENVADDDVPSDDDDTSGDENTFSAGAGAPTALALAVAKANAQTSKPLSSTTTTATSSKKTTRALIADSYDDYFDFVPEEGESVVTACWSNEYALWRDKTVYYQLAVLSPAALDLARERHARKNEAEAERDAHRQALARVVRKLASRRRGRFFFEDASYEPANDASLDVDDGRSVSITGNSTMKFVMNDYFTGEGGGEATTEGDDGGFFPQQERADLFTVDEKEEPSPENDDDDDDENDGSSSRASFSTTTRHDDDHVATSSSSLQKMKKRRRPLAAMPRRELEAIAIDEQRRASALESALALAEREANENRRDKDEATERYVAAERQLADVETGLADARADRDAEIASRAAAESSLRSTQADLIEVRDARDAALQREDLALRRVAALQRERDLLTQAVQNYRDSAELARGDARIRRDELRAREAFDEEQKAKAALAAALAAKNARPTRDDDDHHHGKNNNKKKEPTLLKATTLQDQDDYQDDDADDKIDGGDVHEDAAATADDAEADASSSASAARDAEDVVLDDPDDDDLLARVDALQSRIDSELSFVVSRGASTKQVEPNVYGLPEPDEVTAVVDDDDVALGGQQQQPPAVEPAPSAPPEPAPEPPKKSKPPPTLQRQQRKTPPTLAPNRSRRHDLIVPFGFGPGDELPFRAEGMDLSVHIPDGLKPGDTFTIELR